MNSSTFQGRQTVAISFELDPMVSAIDLFPKEKVSAMILEAAEVMRAYTVQLEEQRKLGNSWSTDATLTAIESATSVRLRARRQRRRARR